MSPAPRRPSRSKLPVGIIIAAGSLIVILSAIVLWMHWNSPHATRAPQREPEVSKSGNETAGYTSAATSKANADLQIPLAARPPFDLRYCPQGAQCLLLVRPVEWIAIPEGARVIQALGPNWNQTFNQWTQSTGIGLDQVQHFVISMLPTVDGVTEYVITARLRGPLPEHWQAEIDQAGKSSESGVIVSLGSISAFAIDEANGWLVLGSPQQLQVLQQRQGVEPLLRRDLEVLRSFIGPHAQVAILFAPTFLVQQGSRQQALPLRELADALQDIAIGTQAGLCTAQIAGDQFCCELRLLAAIENVDDIRQQFDERWSELPSAVATTLQQIEPIDRYWRKLAERFPEMLRFVVAQSNVRQDRRQVIVTVQLPAKAAHNLALATELLLEACR